MRDVIILFLHLVVTFVPLVRPGGIRPVVAESVLVKHQADPQQETFQPAPVLTGRRLAVDPRR